MSKSSFPIRRYVAELLGTFLLTTAVSVSLQFNYLPTPLVAALTLMILAYILGPISGAHVNPAVTIGLWSLRKLTAVQALCYIVSQLIGALLALWFVPQAAGSIEGALLLKAIGGELLGSFIFVLGVTMVVNRHVDAAASGLVVGFSLLLGIGIALSGSLGLLNPAVALGLGILSSGLTLNALVYLITPIVGALLGSQVAVWLSKQKN